MLARIMLCTAQVGRVRHAASPQANGRNRDVDRASGYISQDVVCQQPQSGARWGICFANVFCVPYISRKTCISFLDR